MGTTAQAHRSCDRALHRVRHDHTAADRHAIRHGWQRKTWAMRQFTRRNLVISTLVSPLATSLGIDLNPATARQSNPLAIAAFTAARPPLEEIVPLFQQTAEGQSVQIELSFGSASELARAIQTGVPTDVVILSAGPDIDPLVQAGLVAPTWNQGAYGGFAVKTVVVMAVRPTNPKAIRGWTDLATPGLQLILTNPASSHEGRWHLLAPYANLVDENATESAITDYFRGLLANAVQITDTTDIAWEAFLSGAGDVMLAFESDIIAAQRGGAAVEYVIAKRTMLIEIPAAATVNSGAPEQAAAFVAFLHSPEAQRVFAAHGYRPVLPEALKEAALPRLVSVSQIADVGGWAAVTAKLFDPATGLIPTILATG